MILKSAQMLNYAPDMLRGIEYVYAERLTSYCVVKPVNGDTSVVTGEA